MEVRVFKLWAVVIPLLVLQLFCNHNLVLVLGDDTPSPQYSEDDIRCLNTTYHQLKDPDHTLTTWQFWNTTKGFTCYFVGVQCWHIDDDKVLSLKLPGLNLNGHFPDGLKYCGSMTSLDLSSNNLSGPIPKDLCKWLPFLVVIDLSDNQFTGNIPPEIYNCTYLNTLHLGGNRLTGNVPWEFALLNRLSDLDVSNNELSGQIPVDLGKKFSESSFDNNPRLCGNPLRECSSGQSTPFGAVIGGALAGLFVVSVLGFAIYWWFIRVDPKKLAEMRDENKWAKRIKALKSVQVSMFEKPIKKIRLSDLMAATNDFSPENIIATGRAGTVYKATLADGSVLAIKRLRNTAQTDKEFKAEMNSLGKLKHRNLVPFLGFCIAAQEKLLVYKHMANGTLHDRLHKVPEGEMPLDWPKRLRIGIGAARGFAWLHHSCNPRVLHRNISSASILLDDDYEPRITDFGLARLMNPVDTHLSTMINGDFGELGYVAPEYMRTLVATLKGDVYSFGVFLLELVTGMPAIHTGHDESGFKGNLVDRITELSNNGRVEDAIDKSLQGQGHDSELLLFLRVACNCVLSGPRERPSMYEVYQLLRAIGEKYDFSDENDEILIVSSGDDDYVDELIVARES
eukprot:TRINITY_DN7365_c0_g1_i1.p1 TRINITY_DN7365_c0_g1~~TRINITY_DN7365_c0_g1_i1.p1  ORF type:complete len:624 (-),score=99.10 TRINITY_DN7365_c0_g1_i1:368-2239(-)